MARKTRSQILGGYGRLQRGKRHESAFDGEVFDFALTIQPSPQIRQFRNGHRIEVAS